MTVVHKKTEPDTLGSGDKFHTLSDGEGSESETDPDSLDEQDLWYATDHKAEYEATIDRTAPRRFYKRGDNSRERLAPNRSTSIQEPKKVTTCNRCGAFGHWEDACPQKGHRRR